MLSLTKYFDNNSEHIERMWMQKIIHLVWIKSFVSLRKKIPNQLIQSDSDEINFHFFLVAIIFHHSSFSVKDEPTGFSLKDLSLAGTREGLEVEVGAGGEFGVEGD